MLEEGGQHPTVEDYWVNSLLTEVHLARFHENGLHPGNLECYVVDNKFPLVLGNQLVSFESHLKCGMCFPPSKFLVSFCRHYVHLNLNVVVA
jgi:hypothetical protein